MSSMGAFTKAVRSQRKLRAAIDGPSGAGKTYTMLRLAHAMKATGLCSRIALIDTENNSASLYAGEAPDGEPWEFDTLNLKQFSPDQFTSAIKTAAREGYDCVVVDSLSHAWVGSGGALDLVDQKGGNKFTAWKDVTPLHRGMIDAIIQSPIHVLCTMRSKTEYVLEDVDGKKVPRRIGVAPVQREGMEYEFDIYVSTDWTHQLKVTKSRCSPMNAATTIKAGPTFWKPLFDWMASAAPVNTAPQRSSRDVADSLIKEIDRISGVDALSDFGKLNIRKAVDDGSLSKSDHDEIVKPHYLKRKAELTPAPEQTAPATAETAATTATPKQPHEGEVLSKIFAAISNARTQEELAAVGATIRESLDKKLIGEAEDRVIKPHFKERKEAIALTLSKS